MARALDTDAEAARIQREVWRRMSPGARGSLALRMSEDVREIAIEGEMARTGLSREEAKANVLRRMLGDHLYEAAFGR